MFQKWATEYIADTIDGLNFVFVENDIFVEGDAQYIEQIGLYAKIELLTAMFSTYE